MRSYYGVPRVCLAWRMEKNEGTALTLKATVSTVRHATADVHTRVTREG